MPTALILICLVVGISDGDTITARCEAHAEHPAVTLKVRLSEIDAPEKTQPFGARSKQNLSDLCIGKPARIAPVNANHGLDRYGRTVARVVCEDVDANAQQVRAGLAWVYDRYALDPSLYQLQDNARNNHRGLWVEAAPVAPWEWRKAPKSH
jgi:endonuclease YncB( thermonuclease family)